MRILIVTEKFYPSQNGIVRRLVEGIRYISRAGHEIAVITPDEGIENFEGIPVFSMPALSLPMFSQDPIPYRRHGIASIMTSFHPDIVHIANPIFLGSRALAVALAQNRPVLASYHVPLEKQLIPPKMDHPVLRQLYWRHILDIYNKADLNLCTSRTMRIALQEKGLERLAVLRSGVDTAFFHPRFADDDLRQQWGLREDALALLYIDYLNGSTFLPTLKVMAEQLPNAHIIVIEPRSGKKNKNRQVAGLPVSFWSEDGEEALRRAYASADALIFPKSAELPGSMILEAMASGLPVIAPDKPAFREQVVHEKTGLLYALNDESDWLGSVLLLQDDDFRKSLSVAACHDAKRFSWTMTSQQLLDYYHLTIARHERWQAEKKQG